MQKVLVIVGPTGIGKSDFAVKCGQIFNGEIISGDSVQVYKGMDIGSGKITKSETKGIKHHLIDIKSPKENYDVSSFQRSARLLINAISKQNKLPIIAGGTGLYVKACLYDYVFALEESQDNQYLDLTNQELYEKLNKLDINHQIHVNNRKRLVRALNVIEKHQVSISEIKEKQKHCLLYNALIIGLTSDRAIIYEKCEKRIDKMIENGLINEIKNLLNQGVCFDDKSMQAIGYKEFKAYFDGEKTLDECINLVKKNTRNFIKRQYTWFKNQMNVIWFEKQDEALLKIKEWYEQG